ncbi:MAG: hypothetical protein U0165_19650 [Polyangiaceae bacterium]
MPQSAPTMDDPAPTTSSAQQNATSLLSKLTRWMDPNGSTTIATYSAWCALVMTVACVNDMLTAGTLPPPMAFFWAAGTGLLYGAMMGAGFGIGFRLFASLPRYAAWVLWPVLALVGAARLVSALGVWARLSGPDQKLAYMALFGSIAGALVFALLLVLMQPRAHAPRGYLASLTSWRRYASAVPMLLFCIALVLVDRTQFPGTIHTHTPRFACSTCGHGCSCSCCSRGESPLHRDPLFVGVAGRCQRVSC